jgi:hypothetical protein
MAREARELAAELVDAQEAAVRAARESATQAEAEAEANEAMYIDCPPGRPRQGWLWNAW